MQNNIYAKLIQTTSKILKENQKQRNANGLDFNIFILLDAEKDEMKTHEYMYTFKRKMGHCHKRSICFRIY